MTLSLSGSDMDKFQLTDVDPADPMSNTKFLSFKEAEKPDFENPGDRNGDNVYEVTVVASDATGTDDVSRSVTVKVVDVSEEWKSNPRGCSG